jgi:hypothetical protein
MVAARVRTGGPLPFLSRVAVSEPACEQVVDLHVVIVDELRHPSGRFLRLLTVKDS